MRGCFATKIGPIAEKESGMRTFIIVFALAGSLLGSRLAHSQAPTHSQTRPIATCTQPSARYSVYRWVPFNEGNDAHFLPLITYAARHQIDRVRARWWEVLFRNVTQQALERTAQEERSRRDPVADADDSDTDASVTHLADYPRYVLERADVPWREICGNRSRIPEIARVPRTRTYAVLEIRIYRRGETVPRPWIELGTSSPVNTARDSISFSWLLTEPTDMTIDL